MNSSPLVSVVIPCYNVSDYVQNAIESIIHQSYRNLEIIVINDASTDDTLTKILSCTDQRINVKSCISNTGKVGAVNEALQEVKGDFIAFQDADDFSEYNRIERQISEFKKNQALGVCFTSFAYCGNKKGEPTRLALSNQELREEFLEFGKKRDISFSGTCCGSMMIKKEVLEHTHGYHPYFTGRVAEDIHWIYRILKLFEGITIPEVLYHYTIRKDSSTWQQFNGKSAKYAYSWQLLKRIIYKDVYEGIDVLSAGNNEVLQKLELEACEEALINQIEVTSQIKTQYENSRSYKLGKFLLRTFNRKDILD